MDLRELVSITKAGAMLGKGYCATRDLVLTGRLEGWQQDGRWYVKRASVEAYRAHQGERDTAGTVA